MHHMQSDVYIYIGKETQTHPENDVAQVMLTLASFGNSAAKTSGRRPRAILYEDIGLVGGGGGMFCSISPWRLSARLIWSRLRQIQQFEQIDSIHPRQKTQKHARSAIAQIAS